MLNPTKLPNINNPISSCTEDMATWHTDWSMITAQGREPQLASGKVLFTYDVIWTENKDLKWASRWDIYLTMDNAVPAWGSLVRDFQLFDGYRFSFLPWVAVKVISWLCQDTSVWWQTRRRRRTLRNWDTSMWRPRKRRRRTQRNLDWNRSTPVSSALPLFVLCSLSCCLRNGGSNFGHDIFHSLSYFPQGTLVSC